MVVERDNLIEKVDSLNSVVSDQNITIAKNENQITTEKADGITKVSGAKNEGKREVLVFIINTYKNQSFDELIKFSSIESVHVTKELWVITLK
ncbi:MAG: hypothetical protein IPL20_00100 [Saprospiraceae bacterium]|nr:hypothetical protein [Saprospiraceae bacterium]